MPGRRSLLSLVAGLIWLGWIHGVAALGAGSFPWLSGETNWTEELKARLHPLARWDSVWYLSIAETGYEAPPDAVGQATNHAFFPLYPMLVRLLARGTGLEPSHAGAVVSGLCVLLALPLLASWVGRRYGADRVRPTLLALLAFPTSFFLAAVYTEGLFLLLSVLAVHELGEGRRLTSAAAAYLAGLTRVAGLALAPLLLLLALEERGRNAGRPPGRLSLVAAAALAVAPFLGFASLAGFYQVRFGDAALFARSQHNWAGEAKGSLDGPRLILREVAQDVRSGAVLTDSPARTLEGLYLLLFVALAVALLREGKRPEALFVLVTIGLILPSGTLLSAGRYVLPAFPGFVAISSLSRRTALFVPLLAAGFLAQAAYVVLFVHGQWTG